MITGITTLLPVFISAPEPKLLRLLDRSVKSVLEQDCSVPLELVLIDDGSPTQISGIISCYSWHNDPRVRILRLECNRGLVFALNAGLAVATHPWIARIDSDDAWAPGRLLPQIARCASDPDLAIIGTGMHVVNEDGTARATHVRPGTWEGVLRFTAEVGCPFPHGSILARREVFEFLGGYDHDLRFRHCEDFALWCTWMRFFKADMVEEPLYLYTTSDHQISAQHSAQQRIASGIVHAAFLKLNSPTEIPGVLAQLAAEAGMSPLFFGARLATAWRFFDVVTTDAAWIDRLRFLLPDRTVLTTEELPFSHAERICHFSTQSLRNHTHLRKSLLWGEFDRIAAYPQCSEQS